MRPRYFLRARALMLLVPAAFAPVANAAEIDHRLLVAADARSLAVQLNRAGASGYRLSALVDRADDLAALVARPATTSLVARYEYVALSSKDAAALADLGKQGYSWRASATVLGWNGSVVVLERPAGGGAPHDLRLIVAREPRDLEGALSEPYGAGFRVAGRQRFAVDKATWVALERRAGAAARDVKVVSADGREKLEQALDAAATQGYSLETFWAHPAGMFKRDPLVAVLSRARGATAPAAHCRIETESRSLVENSARLMALDAVDEGRTWLAAWCPGRAGGYWSRDVALENPSGALFAAPMRVEHELRSWSAGPIVAAYLLREREQPSVLVMVTLDAGAKLSEPEIATLKKLTTPPGASPLPTDGGELFRLYLDMHRLYHAKKLDVAAVKPRWSAAVLAKVAADVKEMGWPTKERDMLEHRSLAFDATDPRLRDGWIRGERGVLRVDGVHDGYASLIEIRFVREGGGWKIDDWSSWERIAP